MAIGGERLELEHRLADIAAELHALAGSGQEMGGERGGGRLAVGAGDGNDLAGRTLLRPLAAKQLDVADHLDAGSVRAHDRPIRLRVGQGNAGREHERGKARPVDGREIGQNEPGGQRLGPALLVVVPGEHIGAAGFERAHGGDAAQAQALDRYVAAGKDRHGNHSEWNLAQFQRGEASKRKHHGDDPEPDHHGRFRPALLLEMVMQGRHAEHAHAE